MSAVRAALLLGHPHLTAVRVGGPTVVWAVVQVDGDIDGHRGNEGADQAADREGERALGLTKDVMAEEPSSGPVGMPSTALGAGAVDGGPKDRRSQEQVGGVADRCPREGSGDGVLQQGQQPNEPLGADLPVDVRARPPSGPTDRGAFLSGRSPGPCGLITAAAAVWVHTQSSAVSPLQRGTPSEDGERPRTHARTSGGRLPRAGLGRV